MVRVESDYLCTVVGVASLLVNRNKCKRFDFTLKIIFEIACDPRYVYFGVEGEALRIWMSSSVLGKEASIVLGRQQLLWNQALYWSKYNEVENGWKPDPNCIFRSYISYRLKRKWMGGDSFPWYPIREFASVTSGLFVLYADSVT